MRQTETTTTPLARPDDDWFSTATRWTQLTFTDDDPVRYDAEFWSDVMRDTHTNALCLSAGGYMAFYPTCIPYHHRSSFLGDSDPFGEMVERARRLGIRVMARVDPHAIHADAAEAHPEWLARDEEGHPIPHWSFPGLWLTDPFSSYHRDFITEVAQEIVSRYDVDAIFANRWEGHGGISYADATARPFREDTGLELPRIGDRDDPAWPEYTAWRSRRLSELVVHWDDAVRAVKPHARFIPNRGQMLTRDLVRAIVDDRYPMFFIDKQGRSGLEAAWSPGRIGKRSRGMFPGRPVALITSVGPEHHDLRWKDSVGSPAETVSYIVDGFVHGARPWFTKFKAECFDTRWVAPVVQAFRLHELLEPRLGRPDAAEVAILDNVRLDPQNPWAAYNLATSDEDGVYQALVEARVPFGYVADQELSAGRLAGVKLLVLPSCRHLDAAHVETIRTFVAGGGSLVVLGESSLIGSPDEPVLGLGDVLGVRLVQGPRGPVKNNYVALIGEHPVTAGFEGASRIVGGTTVLGVVASDDTEVPLRFIPDYPDLPMEEVYPREAPSDPAVVCRTHEAGGRTVYVAYDLGHTYWEALQVDHGRLISNAVRWAMGDDPVVTVDGRGLVDVAVRADETGTTVFLVPLEGAKAMRGQASETPRVGEQVVSVRVPAGRTGATGRLIVSGRDLDVVVADGRARMTVPEIELVEALDLIWD